MSTSSATITRFGLYFPYIHFRDADWVKVAALYWPKMARVVPPGYPTRDSDLVRALADQLDWIVDISPAEVRSLVVPAFTDFLEVAGRDAAWWPGRLRQEDSVDTEPSEVPEWGAGPGSPPRWGARSDRRRAGILATEIDPELCRRLIESAMATPALGDASDRRPRWPRVVGRRRPDDRTVSLKEPPLNSSEFRSEYPLDEFLHEGGWLVVHRDLAWIYKCLLSAEVAKRNQLVLTTDQLEGYAAASGVDATQLALGGVDGRSVEGDLATAFGLIAMRVVVPRDLARVPIKKIISVRRRFGAQFDAWRDYVDRVGADLAEQLSDVESPTILRAYLDEAARKYAEAPVEQLRKGLASLGLDAADAALNTRFETPAALTAAGFASGQPIAVAAGVAAGITELRRRTKGKAQAQLASPNAYLLNVKATLEPRSWLERVAASMRKAAGLRA